MKRARNRKHADRSCQLGVRVG